MKFGQILVYLIANISNMSLAQCWRLETSSRPFYDFNKMAIFNSLLFTLSKKVKHWKLKACVRYFLSIFYFSPNHSPSKTMKSVFYFTYKALFVLEIFRFLYFLLLFFFSLSAIALQVDRRKI